MKVLFLTIPHTLMLLSNTQSGHYKFIIKEPSLYFTDIQHYKVKSDECHKLYTSCIIFKYYSCRTPLHHLYKCSTSIVLLSYMSLLKQSHVFRKNILSDSFFLRNVFLNHYRLFFNYRRLLSDFLHNLIFHLAPTLYNSHLISKYSKKFCSIFKISLVYIKSKLRKREKQMHKLMQKYAFLS